MNEKKLPTAPTIPAPDSKVSDAAATAPTSPAPAAEAGSGDDGELLRQLGELRHELELIRGELGASRAAELEAERREAAAIAGHSAGKLGGASDSLFSPAEVRAMSRAEVRSNLDRIRESMRHWS